MLERALAIQEKHYKPDHFEVARILVSLGTAYRDLDNHEEKKKLLERALVIQEKHYGSDHFKVAEILINLGIACRDLGDHKKKKIPSSLYF
ncbi:tetratricopeptide repeat protein [Wolbachia endosymbiont (group A) of Pogonocherus hispidulus]|uniref:tetratricopeptide repeat protein n=1 Tax=Wolbachia endosymbiont (group A) of Pogonocherus hispidulus TaxID=3066136 RepID=UPI00333E52E9